MTIICLIGPSGSGKTTLAEALVPTGIDTIRSYTTRPMRPGEQQGREHIFIDEQDAHRLLATQRPMAYTLFGGYRYFALWSQLMLRSVSAQSLDPSNPRPIESSAHLISYVIDEHGYHTLLAQVLSLQNELKQDYHIELPPITLLPIRIERSEEALTATIDPARLARDADRTDTAHIPYRITIHNDAPTATDLTAWAQTQLSPALRMWLSHGKPAITRNTPTTHLSASMGIAEIIAHLNGAL